MRANSVRQTGVQFQLLSGSQLQELLAAALRLLEHTGVDLHSEAARALLSDNGAWVDGVRVRIPSAMVRKALSTAPSSFTVYGREGRREKDIVIAPNHPHYGPGPTCPGFRDPHTGERRRYLRSDAAAVATSCDALANIDFVESLGTVSDVTTDLADVYEFAEMIANTGKPIVAWSYTREGCRDIHRMAVAAAGGERAFLEKPNYIFYCEPLSPLTCDAAAMQKVIYCAENRVPLIFTPCPIGGGTAPATAAAVVTQAAAESWLGLVVSQLIRPGTPFFMGAVASVMDMRDAVLAYGAPELSLFQAALTELARYVGLPVWSTGGCSDSKVVDQQAAIEGTLSVLFSGLSGADLIHDVGYIESAMTGSLQQLVMMDEAIGMCKRIAAGIDVTTEKLAVKTIREAAAEGNYLACDHTVRHFREEHWFPSIMNRMRWHEWETGGRATTAEAVQRKLDGILSARAVEPLPVGASREVSQILREAEGRSAGPRKGAQR